MKQLNTMKLCLILLVTSAGLMLASNPVRSAGCYAELTKTEAKWNRLRNRMEMPPGFVKKVNHHLRSAAELRHQGDVKGCLQQIEMAKEEMSSKTQNN